MCVCVCVCMYMCVCGVCVVGIYVCSVHLYMSVRDCVLMLSAGVCSCRVVATHCSCIHWGGGHTL